MIPHDKLKTLTDTVTRALHTHGSTTWQRAADWVKEPRRHDTAERGGGVGNGHTDKALEEHRLDKQASTYQAELAAISKRLYADLTRLHRIIEITNPEVPRSEIGAGCQSCYRDAGRYEPVHEGRYRRACRFCGEWRAEHGEWPPLAVVRWRGKNPGKKVPLKIVEQAAG